MGITTFSNGGKAQPFIKQAHLIVSTNVLEADLYEFHGHLKTNHFGYI